MRIVLECCTEHTACTLYFIDGAWSGDLAPALNHAGIDPTTDENLIVGNTFGIEGHQYLIKEVESSNQL
ncbi:hypothetical protein pD_gene0039 [Vibrio phage 033B]|nr:hypothetical protein pD_gene0039 [Vibrio phage 033B]